MVEGPRPTLYDCFNHADLLVSDISSVVPDFVASGKPYIVTNPAGSRTRRSGQYASTSAAYLADPDPATWEPMLELVETVDPMAGRRAQLRTDLLGPRLAHPVDRWNQALEDLIRRAREQWPHAEIEARPTSTREHARAGQACSSSRSGGPGASCSAQQPPAREGRGGGQHDVGDGEQHP